MKYGFDNEKYLKIQSEHIRERIGQFGNKLYLELAMNSKEKRSTISLLNNTMSAETPFILH